MIKKTEEKGRGGERVCPLVIGKLMYPFPQRVLGVEFLQYLERKNFLRLAWEDEWFLFVQNYISVFLKPHFP